LHGAKQFVVIVLMVIQLILPDRLFSTMASKRRLLSKSAKLMLSGGALAASVKATLKANARTKQARLWTQRKFYRACQSLSP
jgi:hypothetical protein